MGGSNGSWERLKGCNSGGSETLWTSFDAAPECSVVDPMGRQRALSSSYNAADDQAVQRTR